jgi:hypothetical protein
MTRREARAQLYKNLMVAAGLAAAFTLGMLTRMP